MKQMEIIIIKNTSITVNSPCIDLKYALESTMLRPHMIIQEYVVLSFRLVTLMINCMHDKFVEREHIGGK